MRSERLYLSDTIEAADNVKFHIGGRSREQFLEDRTVRAAVLYELTIIGEATSHLSAELRSRHADIPWPDIAGFRNVVVHEYFGVSWPIVWDTATRDVPELRARVIGILRHEFPESESSK